MNSLWISFGRRPGSTGRLRGAFYELRAEIPRLFRFRLRYGRRVQPRLISTTPGRPAGQSVGRGRVTCAVTSPDFSRVFLEIEPTRLVIQRHTAVGYFRAADDAPGRGRLF